MKQLIQNLRSGETSVVDVPIPRPSPNTALVKTAVSLVSAGTERMVVEFAEKSLVGKARSRPDLVRQVFDKARREGILGTVQAAFNRLDQPMVLGYSSTGRIEALGEGLQGFHVGQRVACAGGNYAVHAEYAVIPKNLLTPIPDEVDFESAAFTTLGAIALHGFRLADVQLGSRIAVIGLGLLGLLSVQIARAAGCQVLAIDIDPTRVALTSELGVLSVIRSQAEETAQSFSQDKGFDGVLICADTSSADPVELAGSIARDRARVIAVGAVGLKLPRKIYFEKELTFINSRSYGPGRYDPTYEELGQDYPIGYIRWTEGRNLQTFVELLAQESVNVKPLITHRFPIHAAPDAYDLITQKKSKNAGPFLGVLLTYDLSAEKPSQSITEDESKPEQDLLQPEFVLQGSSDSAPILPLQKINLGVLGAGNFASAVMFPVLQKLPMIQLSTIASGSGLTAHHAAKRFGFKAAVSDPDDIIKSDDINLVAILTRHHLHAPQVMACLQAGKHVFCEKPLALAYTELTEIEQFLINNSKNAPLLMVGFNRRFAPLAIKMADFWSKRYEPLVINYRVNAGYIPKTHWIHDPIQGGGRILGEACHFIDLMTFLIGSLPLTVEGHFLLDSGHYQEDNAVMVFKFQDGSIGTLSYLANGDRSFSKERIEVFGSGCVSVLDDFRTLELIRDGKRHMDQIRLRQDKGYRGEWEAFSNAILQDAPPPIPYDHIFGTSRAALSALDALRTGQRIEITNREK